VQINTNRRLQVFESNRRPATIAQPWSLKKWTPGLNDLDINVRKDANERIA
jgi:maltose-binding protein MalE